MPKQEKQKEKILIIFPTFTLFTDMSATRFLPESYDRMRQLAAKDNIHLDFAFFDVSSKLLTWILHNNNSPDFYKRIPRSSVKKVRGKIITFFDKKDKESLTSVYQNIYSHPPKVSTFSDLNKYDMIGFSLMSKDFITDESERLKLKKVVDMFKEKYPNIPFVCGGIAIWERAKQALFELDFDAAAIGYSEKSLVHIFKKLNGIKLPLSRDGAQKVIADAPGGVYLKFFEDNKPKVLISKGKLPAPFTNLKRDKCVCLELSTMFGCPNKCTFCYYAGLTNVYFVPPEIVIQQIADADPQYISLTDVCFFNEYSKNHLKNILQGIIGLKKSGQLSNLSQIHATARATGVLDEDILTLAKKAGVTNIEIGFESGSDLFLKEVKKNVTVEQNIQAMDLCTKKGFGLAGFFILSSQHTTSIDFFKTIKLIAYFLKLNKNHKFNLNRCLISKHDSLIISDDAFITALADVFSGKITPIRKALSNFRHSLLELEQFLLNSNINAYKSLSKFLYHTATSTDIQDLENVDLLKNGKLTKKAEKIKEDHKALLKYVYYEKSFPKQLENAHKEIELVHKILNSNDPKKRKKLLLTNPTPLSCTS